ncbi:MAG: hypothetical protein K6A23_03625 [Butyrivibrio sp.]|nr:hypothetical protein [Butyrivibrio sp.]
MAASITLSQNIPVFATESGDISDDSIYQQSTDLTDDELQLEDSSEMTTQSDGSSSGDTSTTITPTTPTGLAVSIAKGTYSGAIYYEFTWDESTDTYKDNYCYSITAYDNNYRYLSSFYVSGSGNYYYTSGVSRADASKYKYFNIRVSHGSYYGETGIISWEYSDYSDYVAAPEIELSEINVKWVDNIITTWNYVDGASGYHVTLYDADFDVIAQDTVRSARKDWNRVLSNLEDDTYSKPYIAEVYAVDQNGKCITSDYLYGYGAQLPEVEVSGDAIVAVGDTITRTVAMAEEFAYYGLDNSHYSGIEYGGMDVTASATYDNTTGSVSITGIKAGHPSALITFSPSVETLQAPHGSVNLADKYVGVRAIVVDETAKIGTLYTVANKTKILGNLPITDTEGNPVSYLSWKDPNTSLMDNLGTNTFTAVYNSGSTSAGQDITVTPKVTGYTGYVTGAILVAASDGSTDYKYFNISEVSNGTARIYANDTEDSYSDYTSGTKYKVALRLTISNDLGNTFTVTTSDITIKPKQVNPKLVMSSKSTTLNSAMASPSFEVTIDGQAKKSGNEVAISTVEQQNNEDLFTTTYSDGKLTVTMNDGADVKKGKTYTIKYKVYNEGYLSGSKPMTITYKVKIK